MLGSVLSKKVTLWERLKATYGDAYQTVGDYYTYTAHQHDVLICDAAPLVLQLVQIIDVTALPDNDTEQ